MVDASKRPRWAPGPIAIWSSVAALSAACLAGWWLLASRSGSSPALQTIPEDHWEQISEPDRLEVELPGPSTPTKQEVSVWKLVTRICKLGDDAYFGVGWTENRLPQSMQEISREQVLNLSCNSAASDLKAQGGHEVSRESVSLGEHPGKELVVEFAGGNGRLIQRTYLAYGRLYVVSAGARALSPTDASASRLFESFRIVEASPPEPKPAPVTAADEPARESAAVESSTRSAPTEAAPKAAAEQTEKPSEARAPGV
ncbi:MAG: hypothetical protein ACLP7Q_12450 [Isosphaeraceae bacterium]